MFAFVPGGTFFLRGREEVDPQGGVRPIVSSTFVGGGGGIFLGIGVKCCESVKYRYRIRIDRKNAIYLAVIQFVAENRSHAPC